MNFKTSANIKKNRLYVEISGSADEQSLDNLFSEFKSCVSILEPGLKVIVDLTQCSVIYVKGLMIYKKIIDYLVQKKVSEIVRIINKENVSYNQLIRFTDKIQSYKVIYAYSMEQAEEKLENLKFIDGIRFKLNRPKIKLYFDEKILDGNILYISVSGSAIEVSTVGILVDSICLLEIHFEDCENLESIFKIQTSVVRVGENMLATRFIDFQGKDQEKLYARLAFEVGREI